MKGSDVIFHDLTINCHFSVRKNIMDIDESVVAGNSHKNLFENGFVFKFDGLT